MNVGLRRKVRATARQTGFTDIGRSAAEVVEGTMMKYLDEGPLPRFYNEVRAVNRVRLGKRPPHPKSTEFEVKYYYN